MSTGTSSINQLFDLGGRVALVTGSCAGLGLAMARGLAQAGARVGVNGRDPARTEAVRAELAGEGLAVFAAPFDIADTAAADRAIETIAAREGRLDILVNNVGIRHRVPFEEMETADFRRVVETNLTAVFHLSRRAAMMMAERGYGRILMISSSSAHRPAGNSLSYAASKGGLETLTRGLASQLARRGVTCNAIAPGPFLTPTNEEAAATMGDAIAEAVPMGRWGDPRELVGPAIFLVSEASSYVTGHTLAVDGGILAG